MAQICSGLSSGTGSGSGAPLLLSVEEFMLGIHQGELSEEWRDEEVFDTFLWRKLLTPFRQTRTLRFYVALAADLERALRPAQPDAADEPGFVGRGLGWNRARSFRNCIRSCCCMGMMSGH